MRRVVMGLGLFGVLWWGSVAQAQGLPSVCRSFQLLPFADVLTVAIRQPLPNIGFYIVYALWEGGAEYQLFSGDTVTGQFPESAGGTFTFAHSFDDFFDGNHLCNLRVHSAPTGADGLPEWAFDCLGPNPPFIRHGQLQEILCDGELRQALRSATRDELSGVRSGWDRRGAQ